MPRARRRPAAARPATVAAAARARRGPARAGARASARLAARKNRPVRALIFASIVQTHARSSATRVPIGRTRRDIGKPLILRTVRLETNRRRRRHRLRGGQRCPRLDLYSRARELRTRDAPTSTTARLVRRALRRPLRGRAGAPPARAQRPDRRVRPRRRPAAGAGRAPARRTWGARGRGPGRGAAPPAAAARGVPRRARGGGPRAPAALAVLVDYAGFNLRLAQQLRRRGIPVVYYVSPQLWAWRRGRIRTVRECVERMLVIFPFEEPFYGREASARRSSATRSSSCAAPPRILGRSWRRRDSIRPARCWRCCPAAGARRSPTTCPRSRRRCGCCAPDGPSFSPRSRWRPGWRRRPSTRPSGLARRAGARRRRTRSWARPPRASSPRARPRSRRRFSTCLRRGLPRFARELRARPALRARAALRDGQPDRGTPGPEGADPGRVRARGRGATRSGGCWTTRPTAPPSTPASPKCAPHSVDPGRRAAPPRPWRAVLEGWPKAKKA